MTAGLQPHNTRTDRAIPASTVSARCYFRRMTTRGQLSVAERAPYLVVEWHPDRNGDLTADRVSYGTNKPIWWRCQKCGHEWLSAPRTRIRSTETMGSHRIMGCPSCWKLSASTTMQTRANKRNAMSLGHRPDLLEEFHKSKNSDASAEHVTSRDRVWWTCRQCGSEWRTTVGVRLAGHGCPQCGRRSHNAKMKTPKSGNSLTKRRTDLAADWNWARNGRGPGQYSFGSSQEVWWLCKTCGHEWETTINQRSHSTKGSGCPGCRLWGTSGEEIKLRCELIAAGVPLDPVKRKVRLESPARSYNCDMLCPEWRLIIELDGHHYHKFPHNVNQDRVKTTALTDAGWTVVRVRVDLPQITANEVHVTRKDRELDRAKLVLTKLLELDYRIEYAEEYLLSEMPWASRAAAIELQRELARSLGTEYPDLAADWHPTKNDPLTPFNVAPHTAAIVWWRCVVCSHTWRSRVQARTYGRGCRICSRKAGSSRPPKPGASLADKRPDVVADWNWDRNSNITPDQVGVNSARMIWWRCSDCGHEWSSPINSRVRSRTHRRGICPRRSRKTPGAFARESDASKGV